MPNEVARRRPRVGAPGQERSSADRIRKKVYAGLQAIGAASRELGKEVDDLLVDLAVPTEVLEALLEVAEKIDVINDPLESEPLGALSERIVWCYDSLAPSELSEVDPLPQEAAAGDVKDLIKEKFKQLGEQFVELADQIEEAAAEAEDRITQLETENSDLKEQLEQREQPDE